MYEYFEGTRVIEHEDGSNTIVTYEHEPATEPLTLKGKLFLTAFLIGAPAISIGAPVLIEKMVDKSVRKQDERARQKKNKEIFDQIPH